MDSWRRRNNSLAPWGTQTCDLQINRWSSNHSIKTDHPAKGFSYLKKCHFKSSTSREVKCRINFWSLHWFCKPWKQVKAWNFFLSNSCCAQTQLRSSSDDDSNSANDNNDDDDHNSDNDFSSSEVSANDENVGGYVTRIKLGSPERQNFRLRPILKTKKSASEVRRKNSLNLLQRICLKSHLKSNFVLSWHSVQHQLQINVELFFLETRAQKNSKKQLGAFWARFSSPEKSTFTK